MGLLQNLKKWEQQPFSIVWAESWQKSKGKFCDIWRISYRMLRRTRTLTNGNNKCIWRFLDWKSVKNSHKSQSNLCKIYLKDKTPVNPTLNVRIANFRPVNVSGSSLYQLLQTFATEASSSNVKHANQLNTLHKNTRFASSTFCSIKSNLIWV